MYKGLKKILFFFIIFNVILLGFNLKSFARTQSTDINAIDDAQYPGIKSMIQSLQTSHPNWTIKVEYTDLQWEEVLNGEHQYHGPANNPTSLITNQNSNSYGGLWICEICGKQNCDSGKMYCASKEAIAYMMDPRNSLNTSDIFQFMQLSASQDNYDNDTVRNALRAMGNKTTYIDDECINAIIEAANTYHVDAYYIMAKIIEEQGTTHTPTLIAGNGYNGNYVGYYNFFNIGAYSNTGTSAGVIQAGLAYAASKGWTTKRASILGGVGIISSNYIAKNQDSLYYQKFNVVNDSNRYEHQYQQNIMGAQTAGTALRRIYQSIDGNLSGNYTFIIPLYKGMPASACPRPATNQTRQISESNGIKMGDVNQDGQVNIIDVVALINYLNGKRELTAYGLEASKVTGGSSVSIVDAVRLINYLNGTAVLAGNTGYRTAKIVSSTPVKLSPNGTNFSTATSGTEIKVLQEAATPVGDVYWDLVVTSKGIYGYINRNNYQ